MNLILLALYLLAATVIVLEYSLRVTTKVDTESVLAASVSTRSCLEATPFLFKPINRSCGWDWPILSTVQSVRYDGPSGLPMRCDWVIGTRMQHWRRVPVEIVYGSLVKHPKSIFVQREYLQPFNDIIMPCLKKRIVLIIGDHDLTTPRQIDVRYPLIYPPYPSWMNKSIPNSFKLSTWSSWLSDPRISHIFVEHLDVKGPSKVSPIPLGLDPSNAPLSFLRSLSASKILNQTLTRLNRRPLMMRFTNRVRGGPQWKARIETKRMCETVWKKICNSAPAPSHALFFDEIARYPFVLCAHGGGIDPNPQAWSALIAGSIPIIQSFPGDDMYNDLPVVKVSKLPTDEINETTLLEWRSKLEKHFHGNARVKVVEKLTTNYWWEKIQEEVRALG